MQKRLKLASDLKVIFVWTKNILTFTLLSHTFLDSFRKSVPYYLDSHFIVFTDFSSNNKLNKMKDNPFNKNKVLNWCLLQIPVFLTIDELVSTPKCYFCFYTFTSSFYTLRIPFESRFNFFFNYFFIFFTKFSNNKLN